LRREGKGGRTSTGIKLQRECGVVLRMLLKNTTGSRTLLNMTEGRRDGGMEGRRDGGTERWREGGTERWRDGEMERGRD
jgi:hypothetical protein